MTKSLRIVIPGGSGQVGTLLARDFHRQGHHVTVLARTIKPAPWQIVAWDGETLGNWVSAIEGADVVINMSGRNVNCRYTTKNRKAIKESRVITTRLLGEVIGNAPIPPRIWMNASTATIYRHALDRAMDESTGEIGGKEQNVPDTWRFSIDVATSWEQSFFSARTPRTRKIALRSAMIMSPDADGVFDELLRLVRLRLGGTAGSGQQYISWIHEADFLRSIDFLIEHQEFEGPINLAAPNPLPNREFMRVLRETAGIKIGIPASRLMLELGTFFLSTETELILKSRRVIPGRLLHSGFQFNFPEWPGAAANLVDNWRKQL